MQDNHEIEKKILHDYHSNKYNTNQEFNNLMVDNFAARLKQAKLAPKADTADFVKEKDFNDKLKVFNKKVTSNKTKHVVAEKKLTDLRERVDKYQENYMNF